MIALKQEKWSFEFNSNYVVASYLGRFTAVQVVDFAL
jgi:hypothetical protein